MGAIQGLSACALALSKPVRPRPSGLHTPSAVVLQLAAACSLLNPGHSRACQDRQRCQPSPRAAAPPSDAAQHSLA